MTAKFDLQGPESFEILTALGLSDVAALKYFRFLECAIDGVPCLVSRTGYTGERGASNSIVMPRTLPASGNC